MVFDTFSQSVQMNSMESSSCSNSNFRFISHIAATRKIAQDRNGIFEVLATSVKETLQRPHTLCEYINSIQSPITKIYLDRDVYLGEEMPDEALVDRHESQVRENLQILMGMLKTDDVNPSYVLATRHGMPNPNGKPGSKGRKHKLSFRPFILGVRIRYTDIPTVIRYVGQEDFWDMTVYKPKEQLLATLHGCKGQVQDGYFDARILRPEEGEHANPLDYLAQHVDPKWPFLDLPPDFEVEVQHPLISDTVHSKRDAETSPEFVKDIMECLSATAAEDRTSWLKVAMALKSIDVDDDYFETWIEFSKRCPRKFTMKDCKKTWDSIKETTGKTVTIGTLCFMAAQDNPVAFKEAQRRQRKRTDRGMQAEHDSSMAVFGGNKHTTPEEIERERLRLQVRDLLIERWPDRFQERLDDFSMAYGKQNGYVTRILTYQDDTSGVRGIILPDLSVQLVQDGNAVFIGLLNEGFGMKDLNRIHDKIDPNTIYFYSTDELNRATLRCMDMDTNERYRVFIMIQKGFTEDAMMSVSVNGKCTNVNGKKTEKFMKDLACEAQRHAAATQGLNLFQVNNTFNGPVNTTIVSFPQNDTAAFPIIRTKLLDYASERRMTKRDGIVYEPVPDCPCAYREAFTYADYVNEVLMDDEVYTSNPKRFDEAVKFMTNYKSTKMPQYSPDRDLMSFSNGVLELATGAFTEYAGMDPDSPMALRVARHHIHQQYTGSTDTPLLDKVLGAQFEPEVAQLLCALFGRALFKIGQMDGWQVMPYLVGIGGTGKSLLLNVLQHMFAPGAVGNLAAKREEVFGMANLVDKEIVMGRDMPAKLSGSLPQEIMQAMTAGEGMEVPRKGQVALNVTWVAPVVLASNHLPDYINTGNNVGRRLVTLRFNTVVKDPEEDLQKSILESELPNIVCRCLRAYADMRERVRAAKGFWKAVPAVVLEWQSKLAAATNKLHEFLAMDEEERGLKVSRKEDSVTWLLEFKAAFEARMGYGSFVSDPATFHAFGFRISDRTEHVCLACKQIAKARGGKCCVEYSQESRRVKRVIHGMCLVAIEKGSNSERRFREAIEEETGLSFPSVRPSWLSNITGRAMELDMYNEKTHIAVEYDGPQHTEFPNRYHHTRAEFEAQTARDRLKDRLCADRGVELIRICSGPISKELASFRKAYEEISRKRSASL